MSYIKDEEGNIITTMKAHPSEDYTGTISAWLVKLRERGLWNGEGRYGDVIIDTKEWMDILEKCEL